MKTIETKTLVVGAGLTGLSCGIHLEDEDYLIVEKELEPGGIVRTRKKHGGFYCDGTGHWLHLRNPVIKDLVYGVLDGNIVSYERKARIFSKDVFTQFPFQGNLAGLPPEVISECLTELWRARHPEDFGEEAPQGEATSFGDSVDRIFGKGISRHFMTPYNEKLLGVPLTEVSARYAERFVPKPSVEDILKGAFGFSKESLGYNASFIYPKSGGIGALPKALETKVRKKPLYGVSVEKIDLKGKRAWLDNGDEVKYENLVNTVPLLDFLKLLDEVPAGVQEAASKLRATTVYYFDVGVRGPGAEGSYSHWTYYPRRYLARRNDDFVTPKSRHLIRRGHGDILRETRSVILRYPYSLPSPSLASRDQFSQAQVKFRRQHGSQRLFSMIETLLLPHPFPG
ncbi:NAD(P)-binding protein [Akkermansiaceae bacterium]|nr:NAD(P)-binding protein [Akkermansiaceae bacterium]